MPNRSPHLQPGLIFVVIVGGVLGTAARYGIAEAVPTATDGGRSRRWWSTWWVPSCSGCCWKASPVVGRTSGGAASYGFLPGHHRWQLARLPIDPDIVQDSQ